MVDVSEKYESRRVAIASGEITMSQEAYMIQFQTILKRSCSSNGSCCSHNGS